jgi:hypothetical protein
MPRADVAPSATPSPHVALSPAVEDGPGLARKLVDAGLTDRRRDGPILIVSPPIPSTLQAIGRRLV